MEEKLDIFQDIVERTGGDVYLGVVGPVRTGKSTFIKKFMETLVLPNIEEENERDRATDELPQSAAGKTIMTTEPKFIPNEAIEISVREGVEVKVRLVDCVGYTVDGALGYEEEDGPRMVTTPWFENEIPFQEAAEIGTRKVIEDHSTIGLVVLTDGSISDIPRENYEEAEERVIAELKELNKPFLVILNSTNPYSAQVSELAGELEEKYDVPVLPIDCLNLTEDDILKVLEESLYEFPVKEVNISLPKWVEELEYSHWLKEQFETAVKESVGQVKRLRDIDYALENLSVYEFVKAVNLTNMDLGTGVASIDLKESEGLFYKVLQEVSGFEIEGEHHLLSLMKELSVAKREYDKVAQALHEVEEHGYGVVTPQVDEMTLDEPELIRTGGRFGVKLKASAPSLHIIKANINTEVTPLIGTEKQCEELVRYIENEFEENPTKIWESNIFGKSLHELVREGIQNKLYRMPDNAQTKLQDTLQRIVNDGSGGLICIII
ncbi:stage IV sporulation protein A [Desulfitispora alkaliphila]|uniref:stage IV sporulation protein A n=1 Tax=Desulfitispora alkaliphila TaxID=622674 RepID=UPI003D1F790A